MEAPKTDIDPDRIDSKTLYKIMTGVVVPRPIGFISTVGRDGVLNAAPFSFFNLISTVPPLVCFAPAARMGRPKDTLCNAVEVGDFVANIVDVDIVQAMTVCAENYPPEVNEFDVAKLTATPSTCVRSPRIAESPANLECRVIQVVPLPESTYTLVIGRVVYLHLRNDLCSDDGRIDFRRLRAVGRMTGDIYVHTDAIFTATPDITEGFAEGTGSR